MTETRDRISRALTFLRAAPRHGSTIREGLYRIFNGVAIEAGPIAPVQASAIVGDTFEIALSNWSYVDGNVAPDEMMFLCALMRKLQPKVALEIGTFDGNTSLQLALNAPPDGILFTLDLPIGAEAIPEGASGDAGLIASVKRSRRRFLGTPVENKIIQRYGNSMEYDFSEFAKQGLPQLIFIDAGHSYECVRNDTEKSLAILADGGYIVWHDYTWPGVYSWLSELSSRLPLKRLSGTSIVIYHKDGHLDDRSTRQ